MLEPSSELLFDIESDGLLDEISKIHCIVLGSPDGDQWYAYHEDPSITPRHGSIQDALDLLQASPRLIGHNISEYDIPAIHKVTGVSLSNPIWDTAVMSRFAYSDRKERDFNLAKQGRLHGSLVGQHSLKAWGERLGCPKGECKDFSVFTQDMLDYCIQDCETNRKLYNFLKSRCPEGPLEVEHAFHATLIAQEARGVRLDREAGDRLLCLLTARRAELLDEIHAAFPPVLEWYKVNKKTGKRVKRYCNRREGYFENKLADFAPNSRQQLAARLIKKHGWAPVELSEKTLKPLMHEKVLLELVDVYPEVKSVAEFYVVNARISILGESKNSYFNLVDGEGRLHGRTLHIGAVTHRCTHSRPNLGNVTSIRKPFGKEIREMFIPFKGDEQAGFDADGLELRMLAHYLAVYDDGAYVASILQGSKEDGTEPHSIHAAAFSTVVPVDRDHGKNLTYAIMYGGGDEKLGKMVGQGSQTGRKLKKALAKHVKGLGPLLKELENSVRERGYILSLDGRRIGIRHAHAALNTLLQSAGAVVMKYITVYLHEELLDRGVRFLQTGHIHDEVQGSLEPGKRQEFTEAVTAAARRATEQLGLRIPVTCTAKFGRSWADTH